MKISYLTILASLCLLLSSCAVTYLGETHSPTTSVDVYYSGHDVTKKYKVIGHLTYPNSGQKDVEKRLSAYAEKIGADAIVITGTNPNNDNQAGVVNADALKYIN